MDDFELWNDKDERLGDALARAYKHQVGGAVCKKLVGLWGVQGNDCLLDSEVCTAVNILAPLRKGRHHMAVTIVADDHEPRASEPIKPKEKTAEWGFGFFGSKQPEREPEREPETDETEPYHLRLRREAIRGWFKERLATKHQGDDADDDIDYLSANPNWSDEDDEAVMRSLAKAGKGKPA
jgi:hypothetical protein